MHFDALITNATRIITLLLDPMPRILYVDDDPELLEITKLYLERSQEFTIDTSTSAAAVLDAENFLKYDAIIADYQMPGMDGIAFLKEVRSRFGDIPFILFTGRGREEVVIEAINNGADFYLQKGGDPKAQFAELAHKIRQVVERRQTNAALKASEERLYLALESADLGMWDLNTVTNEMTHNRRWTEMLGYSREDMDKPAIWWGQHTHPDDLPGIQKNVEAHYAGKSQFFDPIYRMKHKDGSWRWVYSQGKVTARDSEGRPLRMIGINQDITEMRHMQEALLESEGKYRNFFLTSRDCVFITSTDGRLQDMNEELAELLGYVSTDELKSSRVTDLYANPDDRKEHIRIILEQGYSKEYPVTLKKKDGTIIHTLITTTVRKDRDGKVIGFQGTIRDITEQKRVEEEIHSLNQFQSSIITNANVWLMVLDLKTNIRMWNRAAMDISGYTNQEVTGNNGVWKMLYPDKKYRKKVAKNIERVISENKYLENLETTIRCKDGTEKNILWNTRSLPDDTGTVTGYVAFGVDITKSVNAEQALRESEGRLRTLLENIPDYVIVHREGKLLYRNPAFEKGLGYTQKDFLSHFITFFIAPEYHEKILDASRRRIGGEVVEPYEIDVITSDGHRRTVSIRGAVIDFAGAPASLNVFTDVTDQKNAQVAQQHLSEFQKSVITNARVWLSVLDGNGKILIWNRAAEEISGYHADEVVGKNEIWKMIYPEKGYRKQVTDTINRIIHDKMHLENFETTIRSKQGDERVISWNTKGIPDATGKISDYIAIAVDVTDRTLAEKALSQANKKLNLMSSITRHDILNQLTGLRGFNYLCRESLDNKETLLDFLERVDKAAATIQEQIGFTRDYQDMGVKAPEWQFLNAGIQKAVAGLPMRSIHVDADRTDPEIYADPLFEKVFYNLIDNSLRYGGAGMKTIRVQCQESKNGLTIVCEDDGVGISDEDKKRLFFRGFGKNTGLGLFLTREILGITGITITEIGTPGKGARFEITVPKGVYRFAGIKKE
jgi:PAS domain S-box-containing protein